MRPDDDVSVYLCREVVDMRKSINGLSILVEEVLSLDPFGPMLFVFCNRKRDKVKILYWERTGFVLWYKRLEKNRFAWSLLDGIDVFALKPHEEVSFETVL